MKQRMSINWKNSWDTLESMSALTTPTQQMLQILIFNSTCSTKRSWSTIVQIFHQSDLSIASTRWILSTGTSALSLSRRWRFFKCAMTTTTMLWKWFRGSVRILSYNIQCVHQVLALQCVQETVPKICFWTGRESTGRWIQLISWNANKA